MNRRSRVTYNIRMQPRLLILETSSRAGQVALAEGARLLQVRRLDETRRHAADLSPALAELLAAQGWKARDLHAVLVSRGPGSYTGLRVGIMSAKTLAYAIGCKLLAIDTFAAIALQAPPEAHTIDVIADAQQDKIYIQRFQHAASGTCLPNSPLSIELFPEWLTGHQPDVWLTGPGLSKFRARLPAGCHLVPEADWDPRAESLLRIGLARYEAGESDDIWTAEPLYLRPSSAEEKWNEK